MFHIITGPDSNQASKHLRRQLIDSSLTSPADKFIAIVPEQSTLQMQRSVVAEHPRNAVMNIDIVSFDRLALKVFDELGFALQSVLNDTGKILILRKVLEDCREDLMMYRNKIRMPGFAEQIKSSITELRQYALDDNDLFLMQESAQREGNQVLFRKLQDIRLIYRRFNESIAEKYTTQEEKLDVLARLAENSAMLRGAHIYLDGYTGFTPIQYRLIRELLCCAADMTVTVTIPQEEGEREGADTFSLSRETLGKLQKIADEGQIPCEIRTDLQELHIPQAWVYEASDIRSEVSFIVRKILRGVREENRRYRDYAIVLGDLESYHRIVREMLREAGIPCFIDHKKRLGENILARFAVSVLQLVIERFSFDSVFSCLKCGLLDIPAEQIRELENYCLAFGIRDVSAWKKDFTKNRRQRKGISGSNIEECWDLSRINRIRRNAGECLLEFYGKCSGKSHTAQEFSDALKDLLIRIRAEEKMDAFSRHFYETGETALGKEYEQIFGQVTALLDQIRDLMGKEEISAREYREILAGAMEEVKVSIIPPTLDAVAVGDLVRSRIGRPRTLFLAGVNDGKVPAVPVSAGLFTAQERSFLKKENFELAPDALESLYTQHFYLYLLFTKPAEELFLSYACTGPEGDEQLPSYVIESAGDILPGLKFARAKDSLDVVWKERAADLLAGAVRRTAGRKLGKDNITDNPDLYLQDAGAWAEAEHIPEQLIRNNPICEEWTAAEREILRYFAAKQPSDLEQILAGAFFSNRTMDLDEQTVLDLYGGVLAGSVSRYERFYECPFRHFLDYGLSLQKRMEYEVEAADIGTTYHSSLERYGLKLEERGLTFRTVSDQESDVIAREAVEEAASEMPGDILRSSERNRFLLDRMVKVTQKTADVLRQQVRQGMYDPAMYELGFTSGTQEQAVLRGKIDRVDLYDEGDIFVRIIDYKSGSKKFSVKDIYSGLQLQLTAYLRAAMQEVKKDHPDRSVRPGGVYYYLVQDRYVRSDQEDREKFRMSGLTNCDPQTLKALDTETGAGESSTIAEIAYTKNGLSDRSKVANDEEFDHLMKFVENKITEAARSIRSGNVSIAPFCDSSGKCSCSYCDYRDVCKFEDGKWGSGERRLPEELVTEDIETEVYGRNRKSTSGGQ